MGLACSGPPGPIPFRPLSLIPGFWWHSLPPSHQLLLLKLNISFSLPTVVLWFPAASGEISPDQAQDPQNLQPYLNIHRHPRPRCRCPGGQQRNRTLKTDVTKKSQDVWLLPHEKSTKDKWRGPCQGVNGETGDTGNTKRCSSSSRGKRAPGRAGTREPPPGLDPPGGGRGHSVSRLQPPPPCSDLWRQLGGHGFLHHQAAPQQGRGAEQVSTSLWLPLAGWSVGSDQLPLVEVWVVLATVLLSRLQ